MKLKGIIDCDFTNYKEPVVTLEFPKCSFKCDKLNGYPVCQNSGLAAESNIEISFNKIWEIYQQNPLTKGFCCQGLEPFDSPLELIGFINFIRKNVKCNDVIIIYTGYEKNENKELEMTLHFYHNIIIKWGRYIVGDEPHYDDILGVKLASNNQYGEIIL